MNGLAPESSQGIEVARAGGIWAQDGIEQALQGLGGVHRHRVSALEVDDQLSIAKAAASDELVGNVGGK